MLNNNFKNARCKKEYTQEDLAKLVGVSRKTINQIEMGKFNPTIKLCNNICDILEVSLDEIFRKEV